MTAFVDASAMVAMITDEPDTYAVAQRFGDAEDTLYSAMSLWETIRAVARKRKVRMKTAQIEVETFIAEFGLRLVEIGEREAHVAVEVHDRYGKGTGHPARLNMGDCFAYACAKTNGAELLYKGDDFALTDLA